MWASTIQRRDDLFDVLAATPDGVDVVEMATALGCTTAQAYRSVHDLRLFLGDTDNINVVCDPNGHRQLWKYRLVGDVDGAMPWQQNRLSDLEQRLVTIGKVSKSVASGLDKRTLEGKKALAIASTIDVLNNQLALLNGTLF